MRVLNPEFIGIAVSCMLTILLAAYHLGAWRERVDNAKHGLAVELRTFRETTTQNFSRLELALEGIRKQLAAMQEQRVISERWQGGVDTRLEAHESRLARLEHAEAA